jgi:hypothetical protein
MQRETGSGRREPASNLPEASISLFKELEKRAGVITAYKTRNVTIRGNCNEIRTLAGNCP